MVGLEGLPHEMRNEVKTVTVEQDHGPIRVTATTAARMILPSGRKGKSKLCAKAVSILDNQLELNIMLVRVLG